MGRGEGSTIRLSVGGLSRNQCKYFAKHNKRIQFEKKNWVIYDGDGIKPSTNGTWIYIEKPYEIKNGTIFKVAQSMFLTKLID